jgi:hypothetical protein
MKCLKSNLLYTPKERFVFKPSDRVFNTGIFLNTNTLYYIETEGWWVDWFIPTSPAGWIVPDFITKPFISMYEEIFSRRRINPRARVGSLLYKLRDADINGYLGYENYIFIPSDENVSWELSLYVNDYSSKWNYKNNFGKLEVILSEVSYNEQ